MTQHEHPSKKQPSSLHHAPQAHGESREGKVRLFPWLVVACIGVGSYFAFSSPPTPQPLSSSQNNVSSRTPTASFSVSQNIIPPRDIPAALAASGYSQQEQSQINAALEKKEAQLVIMPIFDATGTGGTVNVMCGPWSKVVTLTSKPVPLILPIVKSGVVNVTPIAGTPTGIGTGIVTVFGPQRLPTLFSNTDMLSLTVSAQ